MEATNESTPLVTATQPSYRRWRPVRVASLVLIVCVVLAAATTTIVLVLRNQSISTADPLVLDMSQKATVSETQSCSSTEKEQDTSDKKYSPVQHFSSSAVVSDSHTCSTIGKEMFLRGGSTVDAAIATSLCIGIHSMQSSGIGGGSFMMIYERPRGGSVKEVRALDFREVAPTAANISFYNATESMYSSGGYSVGVPGEIAGYWEAWQRYGRLPWAALFQPTITMCREGFAVPKYLAQKIESAKNYNVPETCSPDSTISQHTDCRFEFLVKCYIDENDHKCRDVLYKPDGTSYREGDTMKLPKLAVTLERIANSKGTEFYTGSLSEDILKDLQDINSLTTSSDLSSVRPVWREPLNFTVGDVHLSTLPLPSAGPVVNLILNILKDYPETKDKVLPYHRIIEAFKFAYALKTRMGDPRFADLADVIREASSDEFAADIRARLDEEHTHDVPYYDPATALVENHGTSHISLLSPDGGAVALTSTINSQYGSKCIGRRTGIIFNNENDDFLIPDDAKSYRSVNLIDGGKKPQSSMVPTILFDEDHNVVGVTGGSGGSQIATTVAYVLWHHLLAGMGMDEAVNKPRLHHKLTPNLVNYEPEVPKHILLGLRMKGHDLEEDSSIAVCNSIQSQCHQPEHHRNCITAVSDRRKMGEPDGF